VQSISQEEAVRKLRQEPEVMLAVADATITWVAEHPHISGWLKQALRTADRLDPTGLQNDVEMLKALNMPRSQDRIEIAMSPVFFPYTHSASSATLCLNRPRA
jgi:hypothetical protein